MSSDKLQRLHNVYTSASYQKLKERNDPAYNYFMSKPHLALFVNGDWIPIFPGMILGLMKNIEHVDGIAPYVFEKINLRPGHEFINFRSYSSNPANTRRLQFLANHSGTHKSDINDADQVVDATIAAKKMASEPNE